MKFRDEHVFKEEKFSVGWEEASGVHYLSIPVSNGCVDYEEHYQISESQYRQCPGNIEELKAIAEACRARLNDSKLIMKPGRLRGTPL